MNLANLTNERQKQILVFRIKEWGSQGQNIYEQTKKEILDSFTDEERKSFNFLFFPTTNETTVQMLTAYDVDVLKDTSILKEFLKTPTVYSSSEDGEEILGNLKKRRNENLD